MNRAVLFKELDLLKCALRHARRDLDAYGTKCAEAEALKKHIKELQDEIDGVLKELDYDN